jgi:hypothetical protein
MKEGINIEAIDEMMIDMNDYQEFFSNLDLVSENIGLGDFDAELELEKLMETQEEELKEDEEKKLLAQLDSLSTANTEKLALLDTNKFALLEKLE